MLLTGPAVYLVAKGELSAHDALVRFGCAWAFATGGVALVLSTVGGAATSDDGRPADLTPGAAPAAAPATQTQRPASASSTGAVPAPAGGPGAADPAYADPAYADPAYADPAQDDHARVDDAAGTPAG